MFLLYMGVALLGLPFVTAQVQVAPLPRTVRTLPEEVERDVRRTVYGKPLKFGIVARGSLGVTVVIIPKPIVDAYTGHPREVVRLLLRIADGAPPRDSMRAVACALALVDAPNGGTAVTCVLGFKESEYDALDSDWAQTPRQHWIAEVRRMEKGK